MVSYKRDCIRLLFNYIEAKPKYYRSVRGKVHGYTGVERRTEERVLYIRYHFDNDYLSHDECLRVYYSRAPSGFKYSLQRMRLSGVRWPE